MQISVVGRMVNYSSYNNCGALEQLTCVWMFVATLYAGVLLYADFSTLIKASRLMFTIFYFRHVPEMFDCKQHWCRAVLS